MTFWSRPLSPIAARAALMRVLSTADHALAMAHQIFQKIEHLRLDGAQRVRAAQLPALGVENTIVEPVDHGLSPAGGRLIRHQL